MGETKNAAVAALEHRLTELDVAIHSAIGDAQAYEARAADAWKRKADLTRRRDEVDRALAVLRNRLTPAMGGSGAVSSPPIEGVAMSPAPNCGAGVTADCGQAVG